MWIAYVILSICVIVSIPLVTKRFAQFKLQQSIEITLRQFQEIANAYTENGTPSAIEIRPPFNSANVETARLDRPGAGADDQRALRFHQVHP